MFAPFFQSYPNPLQQSQAYAIVKYGISIFPEVLFWACEYRLSQVFVDLSS